MKLLIGLVVACILSSCGSMQRSASSGYKNYNSEAPGEVSLHDIHRFEHAKMLAERENNKFAHNKKTKRVNPRVLASLMESSDIAIGMEKEDVRGSWGEPDHKWNSGNINLENEKWQYSVPIATPEGYHIEQRVVYFEGGRVIGWETK